MKPLKYSKHTFYRSELNFLHLEIKLVFHNFVKYIIKYKLLDT
jgi:hypothetical protein